eukprot:14014287-Ditylum_brightwellii.AAC.1
MWDNLLRSASYERLCANLEKMPLFTVGDGMMDFCSCDEIVIEGHSRASQGHKGMMGKDELGASINAKPQPRQLAVSPETCVTAHGFDFTVDILKMFSPNTCKSDLKDDKLFHCVDDWE